jgi:hypothetical protein
MRPSVRLARVLACMCVAAPLLTGASPASAGEPLYGVTLDQIAHPERLAEMLAALSERPTTRVYLDRREPASYYRAALLQIHRVSGVMGELLDSSDEAGVSVKAFQSRTLSYLTTLGAEVDIWEIGNEVNGNWTGPYKLVAAKFAEAYDDVAAAGGVSALTLYANEFGPEHCGDGSSELTPVQFTQRYVPARIADGVSYMLLSYYPTQCGGREPDSLEVAIELERLHALYPNAALGFGEVGLPRPVGQATLSTGEQIMRWAYSLSPGLPYYVGGYFWWYGAQDVLRPTGLLREALPEAFLREAAALGSG